MTEVLYGLAPHKMAFEQMLHYIYYYYQSVNKCNKIHFFVRKILNAES